MRFSTTFPLAAFVALAKAHGVILAAQGESGSPPSVGFGVNPEIARNCTTINPCQLDSVIMRDAEIKANLVNNCGRTQLTGNIDIAENTEAALAEGAVTKVKAGSKITVTIHQVNADGAGPYVCDLDETSNSGKISQNLTVTNNVPGANGISQNKIQEFNFTVTMPDNFQCTGASTGNICTVRCRNNAVAGPFGGCFAVQQTDVKPTLNTPDNIQTFKNIKDIEDERLISVATLPIAAEANRKAGSSEAQQNAAAVSAILAAGFVSKSAPVLTPTVVLGGGAAAAPTATSAAGNGGNRGGNGKNNGGANAGNAAKQGKNRGTQNQNQNQAQNNQKQRQSQN
ncbi:hypothetical protein NEUTE1DRAFT_66885 [Neurospora tetrasperma FGSC 2508]|uniref:Gas1-like protein n=1 Tax=Neurospora tetrasperma (strain FGSC 2508 / ATCC MYA-4615 / P0657) TaxID=510951 RepID=F8MTK6_NEUT8|nr:uncharacterized protein NEUTE1DRAFT_66885 [Neurospora tetrasperma FGSC 2508]EGO55338.1 hypothetical protein NEUTE1DRAFT_66885 [Neurospora tetrasperma FGSC 2508]EGZ69437.1 hypothetical protein NEUTE2DRAFT_94589 [Neurospora tetrasperma FGSC 2509]